MPEHGRRGAGDVDSRHVDRLAADPSVVEFLAPGFDEMVVERRIELVDIRDRAVRLCEATCAVDGDPRGFGLVGSKPGRDRRLGVRMTRQAKPAIVAALCVGAVLAGCSSDSSPTPAVVTEAPAEVTVASDQPVETVVTTTQPVGATPILESLAVNGTTLELADKAYLLPGTVNPGDVLRIEAIIRDGQPGVFDVLDAHAAYRAAPGGIVVEVTVTVPADLTSPEILITFGGANASLIVFEPGDGWHPVIAVQNTTGVTGDVSIEVEVFDLNGAVTVESLTVAQVFNFQIPEHSDEIITRADGEPIGVGDLATDVVGLQSQQGSGPVTEVRFADRRFNFVFTANKQITEYVSNSPLAPIGIEEKGPGVYGVTFSSEWPGRFPLLFSATDQSGNVGSRVIPYVVEPSERLWAFAGVAIEFQFLRGAGDVGLVFDLIDLAYAHSMNSVQLTPTGVMESRTATEILPCHDPVVGADDFCLTPTDDDLTQMIEHAHDLGMAVFLKPMVLAESFPTYDASPTSWNEWFANYSEWVLSFAELAEATDVELFSIGNELQSSHSQQLLWRDLLAEVRAEYSGAVTYSDFTHWTGGGVTFPIEADLDYHGVPYYYPGVGTNQRIVVDDDPTLGEMDRNIEQQLMGLLLPRLQQSGNPAIATEFGRSNHDGTAYDPWAFDNPTDTQEQIDYFEAALRNAARYLDGVFFWSYKAHPAPASGQGLDLRISPVHDLVAIWSAG